MLGSAAIMLAWVAAGRLTAYFECDLNAWDTAAGALLVWAILLTVFCLQGDHGEQREDARGAAHVPGGRGRALVGGLLQAVK
jgi:fructose-1,6-bisphosphatase/inositol monophosphatase family enzyme